MKLSDFDFNLPEDLIALNPVKPRDSSKLLRISSSDVYEDTTFNLSLIHISEPTRPY